MNDRAILFLPPKETLNSSDTHEARIATGGPAYKGERSLLGDPFYYDRQNINTND